mmetsp:Transcript_124206/g.215325  ORF Transcript_124206/g.215325 Transcript_124206/m.215325 type:complete len:568 (-) Transcript_124206:204-1907(-)
MMKWLPALLVALVSSPADSCDRTFSDDANDESALLQVSVTSSKSGAWIDDDAPVSESNATLFRNASNISVQSIPPIDEFERAPSPQQSEVKFRKESGLPGLDPPEEFHQIFGDVQLEQKEQHPPLPQIVVNKSKLQNQSKGIYFHSLQDFEDNCFALKGSTGLLQQSLASTAHASTEDRLKPKQELLVELELARKRIATLESLLATSDMRVNDEHLGGSQAKDGQSIPPLVMFESIYPRKDFFNPLKLSTHTEKIVRSVFLFGLILILTAFILNIIIQHERQRGDLDVPWFHSSSVLTKIIGLLLLDWIILGIFCFTELILFDFHFCSDYPARVLSTVEAVYVLVYTMTTVGYGEMTPATESGCIFMTFYTITLVMVSGIYAQHFVMMYFQMSGDADRIQVNSARRTLIPLLACLLFGTFFYGLYPGEDKTIVESAYMSVITFLTVGFGDYHPETEVGRALGAIWILVSTAFTTKAILDFSHYLYAHRRSLRSQAAAKKAFDELDKTHKGFIDKADFLAFELIQEGFDQEQTDKIFERFDEFDLDCDGKITYDEFYQYAKSIERQCS